MGNQDKANQKRATRRRRLLGMVPDGATRIQIKDEKGKLRSHPLRDVTLECDAVILAIGQATPPVGVNLFTAANLIGGDLDAIAKQAIWFVLMDIVVLLILSLFPILSLYLPVLAGLYNP